MLAGAPGIASLAAELGKYGADVVDRRRARGARECERRGARGDGGGARIKSGGYRAAIFSASAQGRDLAPRVAAQLGVSMAADITTFDLAGDALVVRHPGVRGEGDRDAQAHGLARDRDAAARRARGGRGAAHGAHRERAAGGGSGGLEARREGDDRWRQREARHRRRAGDRERRARAQERREFQARRRSRGGVRQRSGRRDARGDRRRLASAQRSDRPDGATGVAGACTSRSASRVRSSTSPECATRARSSRSTRTRKRRSSKSPTTESSGT